MKTIVFSFVVVSAAIVLAAEFPYGVSESSLSTRHAIAAASVLPQEVPAVGGGMPRTDSIATVFAEVVDFEAMDADNLSTEASFANPPQAALVMVYDYQKRGFGWMGYSAGRWVALAGAATEGAWSVKMDIDYSLGSGNRKIRYSVKSDGAQEWTVLKPGGATSPWLAIGADAEKINGIRLDGAGEAGEVVAKSGERPLQGTVRPTEDIGLNYDNLAIAVDVADSWGVNGVEVTLRNVKGGDAVVRTGELKNGSAVVDFAGNVEAGESYTYDIKLLGGYNGSSLEQASGSAKGVDLFVGSDCWFGFDNGQFVSASTAGVSIKGGAFASTDATAKGTVTPTTESAEGSRTAIETVLSVAGAYAESDLPLSVPQFALTVVRLENGQRTWMAWNGAGWSAVSASGISAENGDYAIKVDLDYVAKTVAYRVRIGDNYVSLKDANDRTTFPLTTKKLNNLAIIGGNVRSLAASYKATGALPATVDESKATIGLQANSTVDLAKLDKTQYAIENQATGKRFHLRWTDSVSNGATLDGAALKLISKPVNGLESFDSYALGLDPTDELDKPAAVVKAGGLQSATGVTVHVPNVMKENLPDAGVEVLFQRQKSTNGGQTWTDDGAAVPVGGELTIPFTQGTLYRVNTVLK